MKINAGLIIKLVVGVASIGIGIAEKIVADKELNRKVAKEVAKALAENN
jgi:hypothetical protein